MNITCPASPSSSRPRGAFTLVEILITMVTVTIVLGGAMAAYMYGLKMVQFVQPKLLASDDARKAVSLLTEEIRSAFDVKVGTRVGSTFTPIAPFTLQQGNALRIFPSKDTNQFVFYFWDVNTLKRTTNNATFSKVIAAAITNQLVFAAEDFSGKILDRDEDNFVIATTLQFYQLQKVPVGAGNYYDWYQLQCRVTRRTLD